MMKRLIIGLLTISLLGPTWAKGGHGGKHSSLNHVNGHSGLSYRSHRGASGTGAKGESERVHGYTRKNGTQVHGHDRSTRDNTKNNNWSTKGNLNPETGKTGTERGDEG